MNAKLNVVDAEVVKEKTKITKIGPYTIAEVVHSSGKKAWGLSVKSYLDRYNPALGDQIALGRAKKSLYNKLNNAKEGKQSVFQR